MIKIEVQGCGITFIISGLEDDEHKNIDKDNGNGRNRGFLRLLFFVTGMASIDRLSFRLNHCDNRIPAIGLAFCKLRQSMDILEAFLPSHLKKTFCPQIFVGGEI